MLLSEEIEQLKKRITELLRASSPLEVFVSGKDGYALVPKSRLGVDAYRVRFVELLGETNAGHLIKSISAQINEQNGNAMLDKEEKGGTA